MVFRPRVKSGGGFPFPFLGLLLTETSLDLTYSNSKQQLRETSVRIAENTGMQPRARGLLNLHQFCDEVPNDTEQLL
jgi:hypothetical protein